MKYAASIIAAAAIVALGGMYIHEVRKHESDVIDSVINISARCNDGMYTTSRTDSGACSGHGGVDYWIKDGEG